MHHVHPYLYAALQRERDVVHADRPVRIALVGGFKPTKCGIATFTTDVYEQMRTWLPGHAIGIYAVVANEDSPVAPEVASRIVQNGAASYADAAAAINASGAEVVWIQHEFGIYGGEAGCMVLELIDAIAAPVIVTLHTVLKTPTKQQRIVLERMKAKVTSFVVMSYASRDILKSTYGIASRRIHVVEHGAPDRMRVPPPVARQALGLTERPTIMTFGLLGPGKGLETGIRALPEISRCFPDAVYRIIGVTHPNLVVAEGEAYRDGLKELARGLGVEQSVEWVETFLDNEELFCQLASCDIYLTPYPSLTQSTSGTLAYAVALGCAVISTPYVHAREILADGVGILVSPNEHKQISAAANALFADGQRLSNLRTRAYARGRQTIWSQHVARCAEIIRGTLPAVVRVRSPETAKMASSAVRVRAMTSNAQS